ncbi:MAG TPA: DnaJ domain-containing protein [Thermomicrobiales bacterium]|jgi:hypothetical protein
MSREPDYYAILGVEPTADDEAITAAYNGRSLRFRVGQLRHRNEDSSGPTQESLEEAYNILGNPQSRAMYDKIHYPDKPPPTTRRRRAPAWLWVFASAWIVAIVVVGCIGIRSRVTPDLGAIGQIVQTATVGTGAGNPGGTATLPPSSSQPIMASGATSTRPTTGSDATSTVSATLSPPVSATVVIASATIAQPTNTAASTRAVTPTQSSVVTIGPTSSVTVPPTTTVPPTIPPTATVAPTPTANVPPPASEPPTVVEPPPAPTDAPPAFQPTDRIGTALSVNLRSGPGANYGSLGLLPTGTQLAATGQSQYSSGQLWRRFALRDGRVGWVRDLDVLPVR